MRAFLCVTIATLPRSCRLLTGRTAAATYSNDQGA